MVGLTVLGFLPCTRMQPLLHRLAKRLARAAAAAEGAAAAEEAAAAWEEEERALEERAGNPNPQKRSYPDQNPS